MLALPAVLAFFGGGYGVRRATIALAVVLAVLAVAAALAPWPLVPRGWPRAALAALAAYVAFSALSVAWARVLGDAAHDVYRLALYLAAFLLAVSCLREERLRRLAPDALLAGIVVVAGYALAGRLLPAIVEVTNGAVAGDRLNQPLAYWNALGVLMAMGAVLAVAAAGDGGRSVAWRAAAGAAAVPCGAALFLTYSRASWLALAAGLVFAVVLRPTRASLQAAAAATVAILVAVVAAQALPAVLDVQRDGRTAQGAAYGAVLAVLAAGVAAAVARAARSPRGAEELPVGRGARRAAAAITVPLVLGIGVAVAFQGESADSAPTGAGRIASAETNRDDLWRVGLRAFADHPVAGIGTSSFAVEWLRERDEPQRALDAHSLYVETLTELGLVGGLLLAALIAALAGGVASRARAAPGDPVVVAAGAVLVAFAVHAGFDWDWEVPAVSLVALVLAGAALAGTPRPAAAGAAAPAPPPPNLD
ncbi:MAG TPA: O-antigen ligase family protein [Thermoleophilaceae bacterium]